MGEGDDGELESNSQTMDEFLREVHQTSTLVTDSNGLPTLGWLKENFKTKSGVIRYLKHIGMSPKVASQHTGFKYQHCYNVMNQFLKRGPNETYTPTTVWQCPHTNAPILIDIVVRKGDRDSDGNRILYRVCSNCANGLIPGVTEESIARLLPGAKQ